MCRVKRRDAGLAFIWCLLVLVCTPGAAAGDIPWLTLRADGTRQVGLWFFWSERCPHCRHALPFVEGLATQYPWIEVHFMELTRHRDNIELYDRMAAALGEDASAVPCLPGLRAHADRLRPGRRHRRRRAGTGRVLSRRWHDWPGPGWHPCEEPLHGTGAGDR